MRRPIPQIIDGILGIELWLYKRTQPMGDMADDFLDGVLEAEDDNGVTEEE